MEDPWIIAAQLFSPSYIGGWSAAEHWDFTEQIYNSIAVMTTKQPRATDQVIKGTRFVLKTVAKSRFFGTRTIWRGSLKISLSDPTKTIIDMVMSYLESTHYSESTMIDYALRMKNGAIFKRLGFILETHKPDAATLLEACKKYITTGTSKLDLSLNCERLITRWRLWVPESYGGKKP